MYGRTVVVTGTTSGLGFALSRALVSAGAHVFMAARDPRRGADSARRAGGQFVRLDLADLASVREAADELRERTGDHIDVLINNAGVAMGPRVETADGHELQIGTNHLGPAALTWLLMPSLRAAGEPDRPARVVMTSSLAHRIGRLDPSDLSWTRRRYSPMGAYGASKLAGLMFAAELERRLRRAEYPVLALAAHPGMSSSSLFANAIGRGARWGRLLLPVERLVVQPVEAGIEPQLAAAVGTVRGGDYWGPSKVFECRGPAALAARSRLARREELARSLWRATALATGVHPDPS